jgi:hypothetical protein
VVGARFPSCSHELIVQNAIILWMHQDLDKASSFVESEVQNWPGSGSWLIFACECTEMIHITWRCIIFISAFLHFYPMPCHFYPIPGPMGFDIDGFGTQYCLLFMQILHSSVPAAYDLQRTAM